MRFGRRIKVCAGVEFDFQKKVHCIVCLGFFLRIFGTFYLVRLDVKEICLNSVIVLRRDLPIYI